MKEIMKDRQAFDVVMNIALTFYDPQHKSPESHNWFTDGAYERYLAYWDELGAYLRSFGHRDSGPPILDWGDTLIVTGLAMSAYNLIIHGCLLYELVTKWASFMTPWIASAMIELSFSAVATLVGCIAISIGFPG